MNEFVKEIEVSHVIHGRDVPSFWTENLEFAYKKSSFDWKIVILQFDAQLMSFVGSHFHQHFKSSFSPIFLRQKSIKLNLKYKKLHR
jgi:hypothetical protein